AGSLAFVHAAGLPTANRSHFDCMDRMERGYTDGEAAQNSGWLARHLNTLASPAAPLAAVASSANLPVALLGQSQAVAIPNVEQFNVYGGDASAKVLRDMNAGGSAYQALGATTLDTVTAVRAGLLALGADDTSGFGYTTSAFSTALRSL